MKRKDIRQKYYDYVLDKKGPPVNLNNFLSYAEVKKRDFKKKYNCLNEVEADIWKNSLLDALHSLKKSTEFARYSCREKGLAMMYTWFEFMDLNKKFFTRCNLLNSRRPFGHCYFKKFKKESKKFIKSIINTGFSRNEFKDRSIPPKYLADFFWSLFLVNIKSWKIKKSKKKKNDEWMDAMVEKSMVFFFDSLAPNLFDTFLDMLKHRRSGK